MVNLETENSMTSVLNSATSAAHHAKKAEKLSHSKASGLDTEGADGEFGALFGAMMNGLEGQHIAAPEGTASPPLVGLAAQVLGPAVHIITASTPVLSDDSLYAFARSQGMDEDALALIFQNRAPGLESLATPPSALAAAFDEFSSPPTSAPLTTQLTADRLATALKPEEKAIASVLSQATPATDPRTESLDLGEDASLRWTLGKAAETLASTPPTVQSSLFGLNGVRNLTPTPLPAQAVAADPPAHLEAAHQDLMASPSTQPTVQSRLLGLNGVRHLMPTSPPIQAVATDAAAHPESANQTLAASLILGASEAAQFARRLEMKQASQRAERVAPGWLPPTAAGTGPTLPADMALLPEETKIAALETLVIAPDIAPDDMAELLSGRSHGGENRSPSPSESGTSTSAAPRPDQAQRTEQYERLSQRLGEALGQRLAAQIAKGDWRVDLALKPHELGNIDIELNMKEGSLQASFSAGQALTRELIADSLPRLKEILNQLGMDVATMNVNVRQNSQHGGNPTPGRSSSGSGGQAGKGETEKVGEVSTSTAARNIGKDPDGLDVLV